MNKAQIAKGFLGIREWLSFSRIRTGDMEFFRVDANTGDVQWYEVDRIEDDTVYGTWHFLLEDGKPSGKFGLWWAEMWLEELILDMYGA